jgi:hypothetical protein
MGLSQFAINNAKPKDKPYLLSDGDGLHLRIHPQGSRQWRLRFRFGGKPNMMSLGPYPVTPQPTHISRIVAEPLAPWLVRTRRHRSGK